MAANLGPIGKAKENLYVQYANELVSKEGFHCFCSAERLNQLRRSESTQGDDTTMATVLAHRIRNRRKTQR